MTELLQVIIVDDEAPAREGLRLRLAREPGVQVAGEYANVSAALDAIRAGKIDLVFLDVQMPGLDGFDLIGNSGGIALPPIVFVTAHADHAVRAFGVAALDYLLKPVEQERLHGAIGRARNFLEKQRASEVLGKVQRIVGGSVSPAEPEPASSSGFVERIPVRSDGTITFVDASDIDWIEADGDTVRLHAGRSVHVLRKPMAEVVAMLDPSRFARIHRSTIVNLDRIRELQPWFHGEYVVVLKDGSKLKLSRTYREKLSSILGTP